MKTKESDLYRSITTKPGYELTVRQDDICSYFMRAMNVLFTTLANSHFTSLILSNFLFHSEFDSVLKFRK